MTLVLIAKDLLLEGSSTKIEDKQVPGIYLYLYVHSICSVSFFLLFKLGPTSALLCSVLSRVSPFQSGLVAVF